jgi:hypothetical protein
MATESPRAVIRHVMGTTRTVVRHVMVPGDGGGGVGDFDPNDFAEGDFSTGGGTPPSGGDFAPTDFSAPDFKTT